LIGHQPKNAKKKLAFQSAANQKIKKIFSYSFVKTTIYSGTLWSRNVHHFVIFDRKVPQPRVINSVIPMATSTVIKQKLM